MDNNQALARLPQQSPDWGTGTTIARCEAALIPATLKQGKAELGACLTLVSPSGLNSDDRKEWLAVAMQTLSGIPADLLSRGCERARKTCRFPSEIVPTIIAEVEREWLGRQASLDWARRAPPPSERLRIEHREYVGAKEIGQLLKSLGSPS